MMRFINSGSVFCHLGILIFFFYYTIYLKILLLLPRVVIIDLRAIIIVILYVYLNIYRERGILYWVTISIFLSFRFLICLCSSATVESKRNIQSLPICIIIIKSAYLPHYLTVSYYCATFLRTNELFPTFFCLRKTL